MSNYEKYSKLYDKKMASQIAKGMGGMYDTKYTKAEFDYYFNAKRSELEAEVKDPNNPRKEIGNVYKKLVEDQTYSMSLDQARVAKKMFKENFGEDYSWRQIRGANFFDRTEKQYSKISEDYHKKVEELKAAGVKYAGKNASIYIAQMYYGSD